MAVAETAPLLGNIRYAFALTWATQPRLALGVIVSGLLRSLLPAGLALVARGLLNAVSDAVAGGSGGYLSFWICAGLVFTLISAISSSAYQYLIKRLQDEMDLVVAVKILEHAAELEYARFEDPRFQDIVQRAREDSALHFSSVLLMALNLLSNLLISLSLVAILAAITPGLLLVLAPVGAGYFLCHWVLARKGYDDDHARTTKFRWNHYYAQRMTEPSAVAEIKLFGLAPLFIGRFRAVLSEFRDRNRRLFASELAVDLFFVVLSSLAVYWGLLRVIEAVIGGVLTIGDIALFGGAATRLRSVLQEAIAGAGRVRRNLLHINNLVAFLELPSQPKPNGGAAPARPVGEIELRDVTFTYPGAGRPALNGISLRIRPGETVALVGENGAGKTTLAKLLVRLYDADGGAVLFDGVDIRSLPTEYVREQVAFVLQDFGRYEATVAENLAFGNWPQLLGQPARIEAVARRAAVNEMIEGLPRGYDTRLGLMFGEHTLSGGQWQQLALARAFARDAAVLILDEPTANLDARAEWRMFSRFKSLAEHRTTLLISHRFATVSMADRIVVMHHGQIIESGTHAELVASRGHYADLYALHQRRMQADPEQSSADEATGAVANRASFNRG